MSIEKKRYCLSHLCVNEMQVLYVIELYFSYDASDYCTNTAGNSLRVKHCARWGRDPPAARERVRWGMVPFVSHINIA